MWRTSIPLAQAWALASAVTIAWSPAIAQKIASSPIDSFPARFEYVSNNAPFVVFDIAPRTLNAVAAVKSFKDLTLSFVATDALHHVDVYIYLIPKRSAAQEVATRIACGSTIQCRPRWAQSSR